MGPEAERQDTRKAMAYDLIQILKENPEKESYTTEEIEKIIHVYLTTADQKQKITDIGGRYQWQ